jgi:predicted CXXCH cytochrome family protein
MVVAGFVLLGVAASFFSCAESGRRRILTFFFDDVPEPGEVRPVGYGPLGGRSQGRAPQPLQRPAAVGVVFAHPPYAQGKCGGCHVPSTGSLVSTPQNGLCQICHRDLPGEARFVHGPVAVNACLFCHDYHATSRPGMLLKDPDDLCHSCHVHEDILEGDYHKEVGKRPCVDCHNPHMGSNRFFLTPDHD